MPTNPQLLLAYIFGHIKGAFIGADKETDGILSKANGGILFLDEIHRLPPEGHSTLLNTFIRRIPITIAIPNFDERPIDDQIQLIHYLLSKEAQRVNKPIKNSQTINRMYFNRTYFRRLKNWNYNWWYT